MLAASTNHSVATYPIQLFSQGVFQYCALNFPYQTARTSKVLFSFVHHLMKNKFVINV
jgi:hypothetical protein